ncbi:hypothetical protein OAJ16_01425 [Deltaproteobacteria bacterium]|nr:hypothetical protein [Deltaproteobacteria bacterium]
MCNWRPDSETVASRAFAHASSEKFNSWGGIILLHSQSDLVVETDWDLCPYFSISISAAFGPEGATTLFGGYTPGFRERFLEPKRAGRPWWLTAAVYLEFEDPNGWISN